MENPFVKLVREEEESSFEGKKIIGIGQEVRDGVFVWWEKFDDDSEGPKNDDYGVDTSDPEAGRRKVLELLDERGLSEEQ